MPKYEIDMSKGSIFKNIIRFAVPLMLTNLLQIFYNKKRDYDKNAGAII